MQTWEWDQVDGEFSEIGIKLTWESEAAGDTGHSSRNEMIKITIGWGCELQGSEANIVKSFIIYAHDFIGILDELMDRKGSVIWLNNSIRDLWRRHNRKSGHYSIRVLFSDLGYKERPHS